MGRFPVQKIGCGWSERMSFLSGVGHAVLWCLWRLAHAALQLAAGVRALALRVQHTLFSKESVECDARPFGVMQQRPRAIAFLLDRDSTMYSRTEHTVRRAALLTLYAAASGVPYITLHDPHGVIRANIDALCAAIELEAKKLRLYNDDFTDQDECVMYIDTPPVRGSDTALVPAQPRQVAFRFSAPPPQQQQQQQPKDHVAEREDHTCMVKGGKFYVRLCSAADGRQDIVAIAQQAALAAKNGDPDVPIDQESISNMLSGLCSLTHSKTANSLTTQILVMCSHKHGIKSNTASNGFPDPDMAVVFGSSTVMSGFQPWQTRLTEFLFVPIHKALEINNKHHGTD